MRLAIAILLSITSLPAWGTVNISIQSGAVDLFGQSTFTDAGGSSTFDVTNDSFNAPDCCDNDAFFLGGGSTSTGGVDGASSASAGFDVRVREASLDSRKLLIEFNLYCDAFVDLFDIFDASGSAEVFMDTTVPIVIRLATDGEPVAYSVLDDNGFINGAGSTYNNALPRGFVTGMIEPGDYAIDFGLQCVYNDFTMSDFESISYTLELTLPSQCDLNGDTVCNAVDLRQVYDEIDLGTLGGPADLDGSGVVDNADIQAWLVDAGAANGTTLSPGDTNLDGVVGGSDFTVLAANFGANGLPGAYWDQGNFDGNQGGSFGVGGADFTSLASRFGQGSLVAVPEPTAMLVPLLWGWLGIVGRSRRQSASRNF